MILILGLARDVTGSSVGLVDWMRAQCLKVQNQVLASPLFFCFSCVLTVSSERVGQVESMQKLLHLLAVVFLVKCGKSTRPWKVVVTNLRSMYIYICIYIYISIICVEIMSLLYGLQKESKAQTYAPVYIYIVARGL